MNEAVLTHGHNRRHRQTSDGIALERAYLYLRPDVWQALEALMHRTGTTSRSMAITQLILNAETPTKARYETNRRH